MAESHVDSLQKSTSQPDVQFVTFPCLGPVLNLVSSTFGHWFRMLHRGTHAPGGCTASRRAWQKRSLACGALGLSGSKCRQTLTGGLRPTGNREHVESQHGIAWCGSRRSQRVHTYQGQVMPRRWLGGENFVKVVVTFDPYLVKQGVAFALKISKDGLLACGMCSLQDVQGLITKAAQVELVNRCLVSWEEETGALHSEDQSRSSPVRTCLPFACARCCFVGSARE